MLKTNNRYLFKGIPAGYEVRMRESNQVIGYIFPCGSKFRGVRSLEEQWMADWSKTQKLKNSPFEMAPYVGIVRKTCKEVAQALESNVPYDS